MEIGLGVKNGPHTKKNSIGTLFLGMNMPSSGRISSITESRNLYLLHI